MKQAPFWNLTAGRIPFGNRPDALADSTLVWDEANGTLSRSTAGDLKIGSIPSLRNTYLKWSTPTALDRTMLISTNDVLRWQVGVTGNTESGGLVGSPYRWISYDNSGNPAFNIAQFNRDGTCMFGAVSDSGNGRLQTSSHTTKAGGYGGGTDTAFFRSGSNIWSTDTGGGIRSDGFFPTGASVNEKLAFGSGYSALFGSGNELRWDGTQFFPVTNGSRDLGKTANRWRTLYVGGIDASGDIGCGNVDCNDVDAGALTAGGLVRLNAGVEANGGGTGTLVVNGGTESSGNIRAGGFMVANGGYYIGGNKVLSGKAVAVADSTGAGDVVAQLNALLAALRGCDLLAP